MNWELQIHTVIVIAYQLLKGSISFILEREKHPSIGKCIAVRHLGNFRIVSLSVTIALIGLIRFILKKHMTEGEINSKYM